MTASRGLWEADVVLADGGSAHLRPVRADDGPALRALYESLSDDSRYLRFFSPAPRELAATLGARLELDERHFALVAEIGDDVVAVADYYRKDGDIAEVAFTVRDDQQGRGLGTLLLDHLAEVASARGIRSFVAQVLSRNRAMRDVFAGAGFAVTWSRADIGVIEVTLDLDRSATWIDAHAQREHTSVARSIAGVLAPRSVAIIGASARATSIGHAVFRNVVAGEFQGRVYAVNRRGETVAGVEAYRSILEIPDPVDIAVVAVPADAVDAVVRDCAEKRVRGLVVISSGFAELGAAQTEADMAAFARRHGMRVVGPNCIGIVNTDPAVRLNATFAPVAPTRGHVGFASQSGGIGIELLARAQARDVGVSTFVSLGNKADVSGNDLLEYWEHDPETSVILLYLESFGNPRKFSRLARRIAREKPIIALKSGRSAAGARGAASHTAALANPDVAVDELFRQAGVVRVDTLEELFDVTALFAHQPLPSGRRVGIVSNGGGPGILAADACVASGLDVPEISAALQATLRSFTPAGAGLRNPVDLVASASAETYAQAVEVLLDSDEIDALIVLYVSPLVTRSDDVERAVATAAARAEARPTVACFLGGEGTRRPLRSEAGTRAVPTFAFPESAARALARAAQLAEWRRAPLVTRPELDGIDSEGARPVVDGFMRSSPAGGWVDAVEAARLLDAYGIPVVATRRARDPDEAAAAATDLGFPVALKAASVDLVHKSDVGGVVLGLPDTESVRAAFTAMRERLGARMGDALVQPMAAAGVELIVGVTHDALFGPLVLFGMGGVTAELVRDTALRIVPVTTFDAYQMVRSLRTSPLLFGHRNTPAVDVGAVEDVVLRVGRLAEDVPEIAELDCNPVVASRTGAVVLDVKLRLEPHPPATAFAVDI